MNREEKSIPGIGNPRALKQEPALSASLERSGMRSERR